MKAEEAMKTYSAKVKNARTKVIVGETPREETAKILTTVSFTQMLR